MSISQFVVLLGSLLLKPSERTPHRFFPVRGAESGVPFLSVPCFGHAKVRRPSYGGG